MNSRWLIAFLLMLNAALGGYILSLKSETPEAPPRRFQAAPPQTSKSQPPRERVQVVTNQFHWAQLETEDYREYIERLRSIGCPEETIRDIVIADLEKLMSARVQEINGKRQPPVYWKAEARELVRTLESLDKLNEKAEIDTQKREIVRELLGIDLAARRLAQAGEIDIYAERLPFLPDDKRAQVRTILEKANREEIYLREQSWLDSDELTLEEKQRIKDIEAEKERSLEALLTPEEKERFDLWFSPSAYAVREAFSGLETTEEEFLGVYEIQRKFDTQWGKIEPASLTDVARDEYESALRSQQHAVQEFLGPERYAEYTRAQDEDYRALRAAAARFDLPPQLGEEIYNYKSIALRQRAAVLANTKLGSSEKVSILRAISEESQRSVAEKLGAQAFQHYLRAGAGTWMRE